jgi:hypothetical protein
LTKAVVQKQEGLASAGSVLGIDVGRFPRRRSSAVCRLDWDKQKIHWTMARFRAAEPERSATISSTAGETPLACAAFDGPLRSNLEPIGVYRVGLRLFAWPLADIVRLAIGRDRSFYHQGIPFSLERGNSFSTVRIARVSLYGRMRSGRNDRRPCRSLSALLENNKSHEASLHGRNLLRCSPIHPHGRRHCSG